MSTFISWISFPKAFALASILFAFGASQAQIAEGNTFHDAIPQPTPAFSQNELANLVAPIALYPDALLGQVLVACTYPDQVVQAQWWLQQNAYLPNAELMEAAQQQNWDPSVQALVAFPSVVALLNRDIRWTTEVGNAFLAQQADVMNAVQTLRYEAHESGHLESTPQLSVNAEMEADRIALEIQPADPQTMFVPNYDPYAVWGAPPEGDYPALPYAQGSDFGSLIGTVANLAGFLPGFAGVLAPANWGWALSWLTQALFVNNSFFNDFGFHSYGGGSRGTSLWVHNGDRGFGGRYGNNSLAGWHGGANGSVAHGWQPFGRSRIEPRVGYHQSLARYGTSERGGNWRQFDASARTSGREFGRGFSQASRMNDRGMQQNRVGSRDSYFANAAGNHAGSFRGSRSFDSGSIYNGFTNSGNTFGSRRGEESSRTRAASNSWASNSWGRESRFSSTRMPSDRKSGHGFFSGRGSSSNLSSWNHGSSRSFHQKAPKFKAPHYAKSHGGGGGHSSGGHSKRSHRG